jgi:hypothetical protein
MGGGGLVKCRANVKDMEAMLQIQKSEIEGVISQLNDHVSYRINTEWSKSFLLDQVTALERVSKSLSEPIRVETPPERTFEKEGETLPVPVRPYQYLTREGYSTPRPARRRRIRAPWENPSRRAAWMRTTPAPAYRDARAGDHSGGTKTKKKRYSAKSLKKKKKLNKRSKYKRSLNKSNNIKKVGKRSRHGKENILNHLVFNNIY